MVRGKKYAERLRRDGREDGYIGRCVRTEQGQRSGGDLLGGKRVSGSVVGSLGNFNIKVNEKHTRNLHTTAIFLSHMFSLNSLSSCAQEFQGG